MRCSVAGRLNRFWREDGIFLALMVALFALRFWPAFARGELYAPFLDNVWIYGSVFSKASEIALTGNFPYWLDTSLGGFPLYQTPHFSATYPFYFFGLLNYGKALDVMYTLSYVGCFHILILYLNLYILLRVAGAAGLASLCGATVGLVSSNTEVYAQWITIAAAWSWFPLLIAGMIKVLRTPLSFGSIVLFASAGSLICLASPAQPVIQSAFVCMIFFTAAAFWRWWKDGVAAMGRLLLGVAISGIIAACLAGVAYLPMALATGGMIRHGPRVPMIGHASVPWEDFNVYQLKPASLAYLLFDSLNVSVMGGIYVGPFALLGVLLCVIAYRRSDALMRFVLLTCALIALYCLMSAFGTHFGLGYVNFQIPLLNRIREAGRHLAVFTLLTAFLAGLGLQVIVDVASGHLKLDDRWRRYFWVATLLGLMIFLLALTFDRHEKITSWFVLALMPLAWCLLPVSSGQSRLVSSGLLLLACLASVLSPPQTHPFWVSQYLLSDNLASHRVLRRLAQFPDIKKFRVVFQGTELGPGRWGDNASYYGIRTFYIALTPQPVDQFLEMFEEQPVALRELRGAKYFVCGKDSMPFDPKAQLLFEESGYRVYEVPDPLDEYTLVHKATAFTDKNAFKSKLAAGFDYHHIAAVDQARGQAIPPLQAIKGGGVAGPVPNDLVEPIFHTPNVFGVLADSTQPGLLILNERWNDAWHARVNSTPAKVLRANFTQPAVALPAGRNYVEFEYKPTLFWALLILQRVTFLLLILAGAWKLSRALLVPVKSGQQTAACTA
jgi:hypothetical protein